MLYIITGTGSLVISSLNIDTTLLDFQTIGNYQFNEDLRVIEDFLYCENYVILDKRSLLDFTPSDGLSFSCVSLQHTICLTQLFIIIIVLP